ERMREPAQQLFAAVMMDDRLDDHAPERGHAGREPLRNAPAVQGKIGAAGTLGHGRSMGEGRGPSRLGVEPSRTAARTATRAAASAPSRGSNALPAADRSLPSFAFGAP